MAIVNRIKRLFRADVHAILDIIEEPEAILKQAIREMQEALDWKRVRLARNQKSHRLLRANEGRLKDELARVEQDLELCIKEKSEELARKTVGRKLALAKQLETLQQRISALKKMCQQQIEEIDLQQGQLDSIVEKARIFVQTSTEESPFSVAESILSTAEPAAARGYAGVSDEEIELEWMRIRSAFAEGGAS